MTDASPAQSPLPVIGRRELIALPDLHIARLEARVDTGARTSALHVAWTEIKGKRVRFGAVVRRAREDREARIIETEAPLVRTAVVRSSNGIQHDRPVISTTLVLGPLRREIEVSLVRRERMRFRMLLGRTAINGAFLVDPSAKRLQGLPPKGTP